MDEVRGVKIIVILGPTASGKTELAVEVAKRINGAIISADSRQVYRGMDIGTGKDLAAYGGVPYCLIDMLEAGQSYDVAQYCNDFQHALDEVMRSGRQPILCGGSGLYIQAVLQGFRFNPALRGPAVPAMLFGLNPPVEKRRARITERLQQRLDSGLIEEVRGLLVRGVPAQQLLWYGLEYKYLTQHLLGEVDYDTCVARLNTEIHRYAKRQMTYFRKMEKDGLRIHWIETETVGEQCDNVLLRFQVN